MNENFNSQESLNNNSQTKNNYSNQPAQPTQPVQPAQPAQPAQPTQPEINDDFKDIKSNKLIIFIIVLILLLISAGIGVFFVLNKTKDPQTIFKESFTQIKEQFNKLIDTTEKDNNISEIDKITLDTTLKLNTNIDGLEELENYTLNFLNEIDYPNKYINSQIVLRNNDKDIITMLTYLLNNQMFLETNLFNKTIKIGEFDFNEYFSSKDNTLSENIEDIKYIINNLIDYTSESLVSEKFEKNNETININDKNLAVVANTYILDDETLDIMKKSIIDKILNDEKFVEILAKISEMTVDDVKNQLEEEKNVSIEDNKLTMYDNEANMILSSINSYCSLSELKKQLGTLTTEDVYCTNKNNFTKEELDKIVYLNDAEIEKLSYQDGVSELVIKFDNYIYTLQNDGTWTQEKIDNEIVPKAIIYTYKNKFVGFKFDNNENYINYTDYENIQKFTIKNNETEIITVKNDEENITISLNDNNDNININYDKTTKIANMTFNINGEIVNIKLKINYNKISNTEYTYDIDITLSYIFEEVNYEINANLDIIEYINKDIEINKPNSYIEIDEITEDDFVTIINNLYKNVQGTSLEDFINLFLGNNDSLDIY